ncbi:hypothetical protein HG537_0A08010 [Torulaspora globosa]|uniref:NAP-domain-containing protein n=1 Tax=Torulaspora globosa TaxID=48254 RepID=A0A7H9HL51_9SACH|nr:hypothetical protein HG537_0A08010 [Torulaspora sp. CBS 2947]
MSAPIRTKPKSSMKIDNAPTPHNTPASVLTGSFLKNGNPVKAEGVADGSSGKAEAIPQTISEEDIQSALSKQPFLLQSIQDKLGSLVGQDSGYVSQLPENVKDRIYGLKKIQNDLFALERDFQMEMFELEQKYLSKYSPLHERRYKIVTGREEPTAEEVKKGKELATEEEEEEEVEEKKNEEEQQDIKGIPSFWLTALENLPVVSETITDRDAEVLDYLVDIKLEYLSDGRPGFKLMFVFDEHTPFFKNSTLTKTYFYQKELGYSGDFIYDHAEGEEIQWTDNESNPTVAVEMRKQRNKATKQVRTIEKITPVDSFFNFFDPPKVPTRDNADEADEEQDEDELQELEERLALDYSIGEQLKDKLVPRAVDWFTGAALEFEFDNELAEEDGFEDEEDEDDEEAGDEDDEEDEEEEHDDFAKKEAAPECKQS